MTLELGNSTFSVDGSHFPDNPALISAHIIAIQDKVWLGYADFISTTAPIYRYAYIAELCEALSIMKVLEYIIFKCNLNQKKKRIITIIFNYAVVLKFLHTLPPYTSFSSYMYQIKNEIEGFVRKLNVNIIPKKVKAY